MRMRGRHGNCKPNIKSRFSQILVNIPKMKKIQLKTKKWPRSDVLGKLGEEKNGQVQATLKTSKCALFSCICALKDSQNSLVSKYERVKNKLKLKNRNIKPIFQLFENSYHFEKPNYFEFYKLNFCNFF
jgi:hypothetical protein